MSPPKASRHMQVSGSRSNADDGFEDEIWQRVKQDSRALKKKQKQTYQAGRPGKPTASGEGRKPGAGSEKKPAHGRAVGKTLPPAPTPTHKKAPTGLETLDYKELRRIRRGREEIDRTLDLHGCKVDVARKTVGTFIRSAHAGNLKWVLIVTGKGARGEGVLRRLTPVWLNKLAMQGLVLGYDCAPDHMGGSGAVCVRLRKKR